MQRSAVRNFWTFEDDWAYYRIVCAEALEVYDQHIFVRRFSTWQLGVGGLVVSKESLELNFARNTAASECARDPAAWKEVKLLTDPLGRHLPLSALTDYRRFVHVPEKGALACAAYGTDGTFVVTDALLDRFGADSIGDWLNLLSDAGLLVEGYLILERPSSEHSGAARGF